MGSSRISWLMRDVVTKLGQVKVNDIANKPIAPLHVDEVVGVASKCKVPPFGHKAIHGKVNLILHGYKMNVMTHGLEKRSSSLPLGIDVQMVYATLADGSNRITVVLRNNTRNWVEIKKGMPVACMVTANEVPKVTNLFSAEQRKEQPMLSETERQDLLLKKLDLSGLEAWPQEQAEQVRSLLKEYHDIFLLEKRDMGHTHATEQGQADETVFQFVVPQRHRGTALDGCHQEAAHQGQRRSAALMQECFWWPGMTRDLRNRIKKCSRCRKYEAAPPVTPMKPLA